MRRPTESGAAFLRRKTCGCRKTRAGEAPTEKRPHLSRYGGGYVAAPQWLAEAMCERRARFERRKLGLRFWDAEPDGSFFMAQVRAAGALLKRFPVGLILQALETPEAANCYSLGAGWFVRVLTTLAARAELAAEAGTGAATAQPAASEPGPFPEPPPERPRISLTRDTAGRKSLLDRLRGPAGGQGKA